ncbi:hypothetical protein B0J12DRAFT_739555 [Macrophomina phaseolina]|uniref:Myb-like domain-containing protein n=1 Tax=Macrophomina phaseolina TaxID=35725 RepID=A0ABQ8GHS4_9PEZI|nr:hypothetical protein B0J12DRAFT_739555 [Macrophomina phaseolina]
MARKKRYFENEEQLLRELKSAHPGESWDIIAKLYNAKVGDKSRLRTGLALQMKFKKMQAREKRPAKKALGERGRQEVLPVEGRMHQSWTAPSPLPRAGFLPSEQRMAESWVATSSLSLAVPREGVEYDISFLQWHLGIMLNELCAATTSVLDSLRSMVYKALHTQRPTHKFERFAKMDSRRQQHASMPQLCPCHRRTGWDIVAECYGRVQHAYETARHANIAANRALDESRQYKAAFDRAQEELQHLRSCSPAKLQASNMELRANLQASNDNLQITRVSLRDAQANLQGMQAMRADLQATKLELKSANADLEATKAKLDECKESLEQERARCKVADGAAETAYEAAHKSGALADELRRELRALKGEACSPGDPDESSTADLALELVLAQQTVTYLEQMLQVRDPGYIREQVQQSIAVAEKLRRQVTDLTDELHETKEENERLTALAAEGQDVKRTKTRKMRKLEG